MNFNFIFSLTLVLISILPPSSSQDMDALTKQYGGLLQESLGAVSQAAKENGHNPDELKTMIVQATAGKAKCVQKLMPCKEYFKANGSKTVAESCCQPFRLLIADDMDCLCGVFKTEGFLESMNVSVDTATAVKVAKTCSADLDFSECDGTDASPSPAPAMSDGLSEPATEGPAMESPAVGSPSLDSPALESPPDISSAEESSQAPAPAKAADGSGGVRMYNMEKSSLIVLIFTVVFLVFF